MATSTAEKDVPLIDLEDADAVDDAALRRAARGTKVPNSGKPAPSKPAMAPWKNGAIAAFVTRLYKMGGTFFQTMGREQYGQAIIDISEPAGVVWEKLAKRHEWLRRFFDRLMSTSDMSELFWVHFPLFLLVVNDMGLLRRVENSETGINAEFQAEMRDVENNGRPRV
jgi:hypothetical protein